LDYNPYLYPGSSNKHRFFVEWDQNGDPTAWVREAQGVPQLDTSYTMDVDWELQSGGDGYVHFFYCPLGGSCTEMSNSPLTDFTPSSADWGYTQPFFSAETHYAETKMPGTSGYKTNSNNIIIKSSSSD
jgi:hypothetical protein